MNNIRTKKCPCPYQPSVILIARILSLKKKYTEINDIALILFKFVFGRNMIEFVLRATWGERNS